MASKIPLIGKPNYRAIATLDPKELIKLREYYIIKLVSAYRGKDADTTEAAIEWICALCHEMRMRSPEVPGLLSI